MRSGWIDLVNRAEQTCYWTGLQFYQFIQHQDLVLIPETTVINKIWLKFLMSSQLTAMGQTGKRKKEKKKKI